MGTIVVQKYGLVAAAAMMGMFAMSANASEAVLLHAAGSLRGALSEISQAFEKSLGLKVQAKFGPSGLLKDEIAAGGKADVFARRIWNIRMALTKAGKSAPVVLFARNKLCALVRPGLAVTSDTLLERMLDPANQIGNIDPESRSVRRLRLRGLPQSGGRSAECACDAGEEGAATHRRGQQRRGAGRTQSLRLAYCRRPGRYFPGLLHGRARCAEGKS